MYSLLSLLHAWPRLVVPALVWLLAARVAAPPLGWPRMHPPRLVAAWLFCALVPVSEVARLGEVDLLVLAGLAWYASRDQPGRWSLLTGAWVVLTAGALMGCGSWVVTRYATCVPATVDAVTGIGLLGIAWVVLVGYWPRQSVPARMALVGIVALGVEIGRQLATSWL